MGLLDGTVVRARAPVRVVPSQRWDKERLMRVSGTPMVLNTAHADEVENAEDPNRGPAGYRQDDPDVDDPAGSTLRRVLSSREICTHMGSS